MPNTPSAEKRHRQGETRRIANKSVRTGLRTQLRKVREAVAAKDFDKAQTEFRLAVKRLDRAAASNLIHRNTAARAKSRLNAFIKKAATA